MSFTGCISGSQVEQNGLYSGAELMKAGLVCSDASSGQINDQNQRPETFDFDSKVWVIKQEKSDDE